mgnify:CR=1 FL=1
MKTPRCKKCGRYMSYWRRWLPGTSTWPLGLFRCGTNIDHSEVYNLPWDFQGD